MKLLSKLQNIPKPVWLATAVVAAVVVVAAGLGLLALTRGPGSSASYSPFGPGDLTPVKGQRLQDQNDEPARQAFMQEAAQKLDIPASVTLTPERLASACWQTKAALVQATSRSNQDYGRDAGARQQDLQAARTYCYQTYNTNGALPPERTIHTH